MVRSTIDRLIVNPSDEEPVHHWRHDRTTRRFDFAPPRSQNARTFNARTSCLMVQLEGGHPHPGPDTDKGAVASVREWPRRNGVEP